MVDDAESEDIRAFDKRGHAEMSYLPPEGRKALIKETVVLLGGLTAFIVVLGILVALTMGIVIKVG